MFFLRVVFCVLDREFYLLRLIVVIIGFYLLSGIGIKCVEIFY